MADGTVKIAVKVNDKEVGSLRDGLDGLTASSQKTQKGFLGLDKGLKNTALGMMAGKAAAKALSMAKNALDGAFKRLDTLDGFQRSMTRLTGSNEEAKRGMERVRDAVTGTSYTLDGAAHSVQRLAIQSNNMDGAIDSMEAWADAVSEFGDGSADAFDNVMDAMTQMRATGNVNMQQLDRIIRRLGVDPIQIFAQATGESMADVKQALSDGTLDANEFFDTIEYAFRNGKGEFESIAGAAKVAGTTWQGVIANMQTSTVRGMASIVTSLDDALGETRFGSLKSNITRFGNTFETVLITIGKVAASTIIFLDRYEAAVMGVIVAFGAYKVMITFKSVLLATSKAVEAATVVKKTYNALTMTEIATRTIANDKLSLSTILLGKMSGALTLAEVKTALLAKKTALMSTAQTNWNATKVLGNSLLSIGATLYGVMTGNITLLTAKTMLLTAAKAALNAVLNANPFLFIVTAIGAVVTATIGLVKWFNRSSDASIELKEQQEALAEEMDDFSNSIKENKAAHEENVNSITANRNANYRLVRQLKELEGVENKSAVQKRQMALIVDQLNGEIEGLNLQYDEENDHLNMSIDQIRQKNKLYAEQDKSVAIQEQLVEMLQKEAEIDLKLEDLKDQRAEYDNQLQLNIISEKEHAELLEGLKIIEEDLIETKRELGDEIGVLEGQWEESIETIEDLENKYVDSFGEMAFATEESVDRQIGALDQLNDAQQGVVESVGDMFENVSKSLSDLTGEYEKNAELTWDVVQQNQKDIIEATNEHTAIYSELVASGISEEYLKAIGADKIESLPLLQSMQTEGVDIVKAAESEWHDAHKKNADTLVDAFDFEPEHAEAIKSYITEGVGGSLAQAIEEADFASIGRQIPENTAEGIEENQEPLNNSSDAMAKATEDYLTERFSEGGFKDAGKLIPNEVSGGIEEETPKVRKSTNTMVQESDKEMKTIVPAFTDHGTNAVKGLTSGMLAESGNLYTNVSTIAQDINKRFKSDLGIHSPSRVTRDEVGKPIVEGIATGIDNNTNLVSTSINKMNNDMIKDTKSGAHDVTKNYEGMSRDMDQNMRQWPNFARSAMTAVVSVLRTQTATANSTVRSCVSTMTGSLNTLIPNFRGIGQNAMAGLNQGLLNGRGRVLSTARSIANEVTRTMQNALNINSPSRVMRDEVGRFIPEGIAVGIEENSNVIGKALTGINDDMIRIPKISAESLIESGRGGLVASASYNNSSSTYDNSVVNHNEGLFNGATIVWNNKEDIRQTMQDIAWMTQREGVKM